MSRTAAAAATMTLALWGLTGAAVAQTPAPAAAQAPAARQPADAATRASYDRADALSRSVFWAQEQQVNPMDPIAGVKLAQALREMGQFDQAAETAQGVLTVQPANLDAMLEVGRAHIARGQAFYGIAALEQARAAAPRDWRPYANVADFKWESTDYKVGVEYDLTPTSLLYASTSTGYEVIARSYGGPVVWRVGRKCTGVTGEGHRRPLSIRPGSRPGARGSRARRSRIAASTTGQLWITIA